MLIWHQDLFSDSLWIHQPSDQNDGPIRHLSITVDLHAHYEAEP